MEQILEMIGKYGGAPAVITVGLAGAFWKFIWPVIKKAIDENAKREDKLIRVLIRSNCLAKAQLEALKKLGVEVTIPEISEGDI